MSVKEKVGETWTIDALEEGDLIEFDSNEATNLFLAALYEHSRISEGMSNAASLVEYMLNAGNGRRYDIKHGKPAGMATLLFGKYATHRQTGNMLAGFVAAHHGLPFETSMRAFGAFNLANNEIGINMLYHFVLNPGPPSWGERLKSSQYQQIGWRLHR